MHGGAGRCRCPWRRTAAPVAEDRGPIGEEFYDPLPRRKESVRQGTKRERAECGDAAGRTGANINNHPPPPRLLLVKQTLHRLRNSSTPV